MKRKATGEYFVKYLQNIPDKDLYQKYTQKTLTTQQLENK